LRFLKLGIGSSHIQQSGFDSTLNQNPTLPTARYRSPPPRQTHLATSQRASPSTTIMASTTPLAEPPSTTRVQRTRSKSPGTRISRPTTPLRPSSRSSFRSSLSRGRAPYASSANPLEDLQDGFTELSDAMADLEQNFAHLQLMHESLSRFSESFASFLYGLNMNAFCVDFPEVRFRHSLFLFLFMPACLPSSAPNQSTPSLEIPTR
jgi:DASH complex subunit DAM1